MAEKLRLYGHKSIMLNETILASTYNKDEVEFNIEAIKSFCNIDFRPYDDCGVQVFKVLNYAGTICKFNEDRLSMDFTNHQGNEDLTFEFYRKFKGEDDNDIVKEIVAVLLEIYNNYNSSEGEIEFIDEDED